MHKAVRSPGVVQLNQLDVGVAIMKTHWGESVSDKRGHHGGRRDQELIH